MISINMMKKQLDKKKRELDNIEAKIKKSNPEDRYLLSGERRAIIREMRELVGKIYGPYTPKEMSPINGDYNE